MVDPVCECVYHDCTLSIGVQHMAQRKLHRGKDRIGVHVTPDLFKRIQNDAKREDRSMNYIVNRILNEHYDRKENGE